MGGQQHPRVMGRWETPPAPLVLQCPELPGHTPAHRGAKCLSDPGEKIFRYFCCIRLHAQCILGQIYRTFALKEPNL